jgi:hypothetical protein
MSPDVKHRGTVLSPVQEPNLDSGEVHGSSADGQDRAGDRRQPRHRPGDRSCFRRRRATVVGCARTVSSALANNGGHAVVGELACATGPSEVVQSMLDQHGDIDILVKLAPGTP